jgi:hypothetical protein
MILRIDAMTHWIALVILTIGCDERVTEVARESADRQAQQNTVMAALHQEVASGTRSLVKADAQARHELLVVHRDLQAERQRLDTSWNSLESERQQIAARRQTESLLVPLLKLGGGAVLAVVLLAYLWHVLVGLRTGDPADVEFQELLVEQLLTDSPVDTSCPLPRLDLRSPSDSLPPN